MGIETENRTIEAIKTKLEEYIAKSIVEEDWNKEAVVLLDLAVTCGIYPDKLTAISRVFVSAVDNGLLKLDTKCTLLYVPLNSETA